MIITIRKKAQEVSFVLLKIAGYIRHKELAGRIESISYQIIESLYSDNLADTVKKIDAAIGLAALGSNVGEINQNNSSIVLRELENLKNGIRQYQETRDVREFPSVEGLFSKLTIAAPAKSKPAQSQSQIRPSLVNKTREQISSLSSDSGNGSIIRQDKIMERINSSQGSKLQLKDIIAAFPDISERTLRYDLVKLCQIGKLRREGSGGPSNFYVSSGSQVAASTSPASNEGVIEDKPSSL